jgi:Haem-binding domain
MKKKLKWPVIFCGVIFLLLQLTNPPRTNPPVKSDLIATLHPPAPVAASLVAACYDCHSNQTKWRWYAHIAPVSWLIANDVKEGRDALNLSEWPVDDADTAADQLDGMSKKITYNKMPPQKYTAIHADARFTPEQRKALVDWLDATADKVKSSAK